MSCMSLDEGLAGRWGQWMRETFREPRAVVAAFGVSPRTAEYWLAGEIEPRGRHLAAALAAHPEAIPQLIGGRDA